MVTGVILAAGESNRMNQNKMKLPFRETFLLDHTCLIMARFCDKIIVVRGHYKDDYVLSATIDIPVVFVDNNNYKQGMFSSIQCGVKKADHSDLFIIPGDYPLVKPTTYEKLLLGSKMVRVPVYQNRRGHPLFLSKSITQQLLEEPVTSNLKQFRNRFEIEHIEVDDPYILFDVDDMLEYQKLLDLERMD